MDKDKAMIQFENIKMQMEIAELRIGLSTARQIIKKQAQRIHELEASYTSGIKLKDGGMYV